MTTPSWQSKPQRWQTLSSIHSVALKDETPVPLQLPFPTETHTGTFSAMRSLVVPPVTLQLQHDPPKLCLARHHSHSAHPMKSRTHIYALYQEYPFSCDFYELISHGNSWTNNFNHILFETLRTDGVIVEQNVKSSRRHKKTKTHHDVNFTWSYNIDSLLLQGYERHWIDIVCEKCHKIDLTWVDLSLEIIAVIVFLPTLP